MLDYRTFFILSGLLCFLIGTYKGACTNRSEGLDGKSLQKRLILSWAGALAVWLVLVIGSGLSIKSAHATPKPDVYAVELGEHGEYLVYTSEDPVAIEGETDQILPFSTIVEVVNDLEYGLDLRCYAEKTVKEFFFLYTDIYVIHTFH